MYTMHLIEYSTCNKLKFLLILHQDHEVWSQKVQRNAFLLTGSVDLLHFTLDRSHFVSLKIEKYKYTSP